MENIIEYRISKTCKYCPDMKLIIQPTAMYANEKLKTRTHRIQCQKLNRCPKVKTNAKVL